MDCGLCGQLPKQQAKQMRVFFQAEDGIRDRVRARGLGDVYKRQGLRLALRFHLGDGNRGLAKSESGLVRQAHVGHALSLIHI